MTTYTPSETIDKYLANKGSKVPLVNSKISQPKGILRQVKHMMTIGDSDTSVFCCKFDEHDKYLAAGYGDGITRIYNVEN
jgi:hypothetical protein